MDQLSQAEIRRANEVVRQMRLDDIDNADRVRVANTTLGGERNPAS